MTAPSFDGTSIKLGNEIGRGGFGAVFKATLNVHTAVAVKMFQDGLQPVQEIQKEADMMIHVTHPHVAKCFGMYYDGKVVGMVMEYADAGSLSSIIHKRQGGLPVSDICVYGSQISSGMEALYGVYNIAHRDIKPANILMVSTYDPERHMPRLTAKITDFGLSKMKKPTADISRMNPSSGFRGTLTYAAPECLGINKDKEEHLGEKSDVYSFSLLLHEMCSGEVPYIGYNVSRFITDMTLGKRLQIPRNMGNDLAELVTRSWNQEPTQRPSFTQITRALNRMSENLARGMASTPAPDIIRLLDPPQASSMVGTTPKNTAFGTPTSPGSPAQQNSPNLAVVSPRGPTGSNIASDTGERRTGKIAIPAVFNANPSAGLPIKSGPAPRSALAWAQNPNAPLSAHSEKIPPHNEAVSPTNAGNRNQQASYDDYPTNPVRNEIPVNSFSVGSQVKLSENYTHFGDASNGPLRPGTFGTVTALSSGQNPRFKVKDQGNTEWWYDFGALSLYTGATERVFQPVNSPRPSVSSNVTSPRNSTAPTKPRGKVTPDQARAGLKVCRGPDWNWGDQDGGRGEVGTLTESTAKGWWYVIWESGNANHYRVGGDGSYDLNFVDPSKQAADGEIPIGARVVLSASFKECSDAVNGPLQPGDVGILRENDKSAKPYKVETAAGKVHWYQASVLQVFDASSVPVGEKVTKALARSGLKVCRGPDWKWGDADGGKDNTGLLVDSPTQGYWRVRWNSNSVGTYRVGADGAFDLKFAKNDTTAIEAPKVGGFVRLSNCYRSEGASGPLSIQDIGLVIQYDISSKPFQVRAPTGKQGWYSSYSLIACEAPSSHEGSPVTALNAKDGLRVRRGADWNSGNQDGGKGGIGTMETSSGRDGWWNVRWDNGYSGKYRVGAEASFDLEFADQRSKPPPITKLSEGDYVKLVSNYSDFEDATDGPMKPNQLGLVVGVDESTKPYKVKAENGKTWWYMRAVLVKSGTECPRSAGSKVSALNAKADLRVRRGPGWTSGNQDGGKGKSGKLKSEARVGVWRVEWDNGDSGNYRVGESDVFELEISDAPLPTPPPPPPSPKIPSTQITVGSRVVLARGFESHGDAKDGPLSPGEEGTVVVDDKSTKPFKVKAPSGKEWWYHKEAVTTPGSPNAALPLSGGGLTGRVTESNARAGLSVQRGADWNWGDQDGGNGHIGTLREGSSSRGWWKVEWENGNSNNYRVGADGKYDLVFASQGRSSPPASQITVGSRVVLARKFMNYGDAKDGPLSPGVEGTVVVDDKSSKPYKVRAPSGKEWWYHKDAVTLPGSSDAVHHLAGQRVTESNAKVDMRVCRGPDWKWGDQDGGNGRIGTLKRPDSKGWWNVEWPNGSSNNYRAGAEGKHDLVFALNPTGDDSDSDSDSDSGSGSETPANLQSLLLLLALRRALAD